MGEVGLHPAVCLCYELCSHDTSKSLPCLRRRHVANGGQQDIILYAWYGVFGRKKKDNELQFPVRIILRREKRRRARQPKPSSSSAPERKPMPEMLKKLAPVAKAVTTFASRTTTNLRKKSVDLAQFDESITRRRLSLRTIQRAIPGAISRRSSASDAWTSSRGASSSSASSISTSSVPRRLVRFSTFKSDRKSFLRPPASLSRPSLVRRFSTTFSRTPTLESVLSAAPEQLMSEVPLAAAQPKPSARLVGATLVKSSPDDCYRLMRTSIDELPDEEERATSEEGYTSSEGSLSMDSENVDSARSSIDASAGAVGQATVSGPLCSFQQTLQWAVPALPKPQFILV